MTAWENSGRPPDGPQAAASLDLDWTAGDLALLRRAYAVLRPGKLGPRDRWRTLASAPVLKALVHRPRRLWRVPLKILYFHGGGWVLGSPLSHADISRALCEACGAETWSLDYRLLPGPAPAAPLRDGVAAAQRLLAREPALRLVLAGDSAGAAIALAVTQALVPRWRARLLGVLAFYGGYGLTDSTSIRIYGRRADGLDRASLELMYRRLCAPESPHPFTTGALSRRRLPPVALFVGDRDPLLADSLEMHAALSVRGSASSIVVVPGAEHSYLHDLSQEEARKTICQAAAWISRWHKEAAPIPGKSALGRFCKHRRCLGCDGPRGAKRPPD